LPSDAHALDEDALFLFGDATKVDVFPQSQEILRVANAVFQATPPMELSFSRI
jgi:hypothetical protein